MLGGAKDFKVPFVDCNKPFREPKSTYIWIICNSYVYIQENVSEKAAYRIWAILFRCQCIMSLHKTHKNSPSNILIQHPTLPPDIFIATHFPRRFLAVSHLLKTSLSQEKKLSPWNLYVSDAWYKIMDSIYHTCYRVIRYYIFFLI